MVSAQPISFRELKLTVPVAQQHENNAANVKRGGGGEISFGSLEHGKINVYL